jgi:hypothetical protein
MRQKQCDSNVLDLVSSNEELMLGSKEPKKE